MHKLGFKYCNKKKLNTSLLCVEKIKILHTMCFFKDNVVLLKNSNQILPPSPQLPRRDQTLQDLYNYIGPCQDNKIYLFCKIYEKLTIKHGFQDDDWLPVEIDQWTSTRLKVIVDDIES